ncbi:MAG: TraR/DksA C4-type zinc finger protein [Actinomycetes bacterium]|jgi:DnaK suppressor protein|nr:MAG: hypothetical protein DIU67_05935 [Actinomycetota bacterium]
MTAPQPIAGETVSPELLARLRAELEEQREARLAQLEEIPADEVERAFRDLAEKALEEIEAALERIDAGVYGLCERCQAPISVARLEVMPQTPFCVGCASVK